jgi:hypothetical protein
MQPREIDIGPVHDVESTRLQRHQAERMYAVQLAVRDSDLA